MKNNKKQARSGVLVTNNAPAANTDGGFQQITANLRTTKTRKETLDGREYIVANMVMIVEGVHAGSQGPLYYPAAELGKTPSMWDHKPIVVNHPTKNGQAVSACSKESIEKYGIGLVMNTKFDKAGRLTAEAWIDSAKAEKVERGDVVINALNSGTVLEVSTGLFTDHKTEAGEFEGETYDMIAVNYRADHLAVLPDMEGACSVKKGAGLLRNNKGYTVPELRALEQAAIFTANAASMSAVVSAVERALVEKLVPSKSDGSRDYAAPWPYILDVYETYVVYSLGSKFFKLSFSADQTAKITFDGEASEVVRTVAYEAAPVGNSAKPNTQPTQNAMKDKLIAKLIANHGWTESDRPTLNNMTEDQLKRMVPEPVVINDAETAKKHATPEIAALIENAQAAEKKERADLITAITANEANTFTKEQLEAMPVVNLKAIAALAKPAKPAGDYSGQSGGITANAGGKEEAPLGLLGTADAAK